MSDRAYINPKVFKWARESARISEETAAAKIPVSIEKFREWENGISQPTIRQTQLLAKMYKRSFALFFLPDVPKDFQPLQDFRMKDSKNLSTASIFIIREIQQKQAWISELNETNNENRNPFVGKFSINDNPKDVAKDILRVLDLDPLNYNSDNPIKEWIVKAELNGIYISRTSFIHTRLKLDSEEIQGFAIADPYAPFVFINSDDWNAPQLFTLVHELAHIWIAETGISNHIEIDIKTIDKFHPIELFCNEVAANALIPHNYITGIESAIFKHSGEVFQIAKKLGVSSFAFIVRALKLQLIDPDIYRKLKHDATIEYNNFIKNQEIKKAKLKEKEKKGGPDYYLLQLNRNSRLFTQTVLDSFHGGSIEPTVASSLLNVHINKFQKLEEQLYK